MANLIRPLGFVVLGSLAGAGGVAWWLGAEPGMEHAAQTASSGPEEPLYWVAPMDPNFRRDEPGKSPMGMDLVPVYADGEGDDAAGTVRISPNVVNNLGVRTDMVIQGRLPNNITTVGYVQYNEDEMVHVHPRVEGWIETLYVKAEGEPVEQGKPLYTLYSPTLVNAQEELLLALNRGNDRLVDAAEQRLLALNVPASVVRQLRQTRELQRTMTVYAPGSGVIENLNVREGMFIKPGDRVLTIAALDEVWVIGEIFESQLSAVESGNRAVMTLDYMPGREWRGRVDYVYPEINPKTRTARVRMRFDNADGALMPGMFARLNVKGDRGERSLLVPRESVIRTGNSDRVVLALEEGAFRSVEVTVGRFAEQYAEILDGIRPGETVVTSAQFLIDSESSKASDFERMEPPAGSMNHEGMDHGAMDHGSMENGAMDTSTMDNSTVDHSTVDHSTVDHSTMDHGTMNDGGDN